jgi:hypothetical protein
MHKFVFGQMVLGDIFCQEYCWRTTLKLFFTSQESASELENQGYQDLVAFHLQTKGRRED